MTGRWYQHRQRRYTPEFQQGCLARNEGNKASAERPRRGRLHVISLREHTAYLLFFLALLLFLASLRSISPGPISSSEFLGLVSRLPPSYWIGMGLVSILLLLTANRTDGINPAFAVLILVCLYLFGVTVLTQENPRGPWTFEVASMTTLETADNHVDILGPHNLRNYAAWPVVHILSTFLVKITGTPIDDVLKWTPLGWALGYSLIGYAVGKKFVNARWGGIYVGSLGLSAFFVQNYYCAQTIAHILSVSILYVILEEREGPKFQILEVILFTTLVMTHGLTSIFMLIGLILYHVRYHTTRVTVFQGSFQLFWWTFIAGDFLREGFRSIWAQISLLDPSIPFYDPTSSMPVTLESLIGRGSQLFFYGYLLLSGIIALQGYLREGSSPRRRTTAICILLVAPSPFFIFMRYGMEMDSRVYLLSILPLVTVSGIWLARRRLIMAMVLVTALFISVPANYWLEAEIQNPSGELAMGSFIALNVLPETDELLFIYYDQYTQYLNPRLELYVMNFWYVREIGLEETIDRAHWIADSILLRNHLVKNTGLDTFPIWIQTHQLELMKPYSNSVSSVYRRTAS
jgi:hypothetical protein